MCILGALSVRLSVLDAEKRVSMQALYESIRQKVFGAYCKQKIFLYSFTVYLLSSDQLIHL